MTYLRIQSAEAWAQQLNFAAIERTHGLPKGVLANLVRQESSGNCDAIGPMTSYGERARGLCQFMPKTAKSLGVDPLDPVSSINGAAKYLEQLSDMFDGDITKALAAYNWGPGNMRKLLRNHPQDWQKHLPAETKHYLAVVGKDIGASFVERQRTGTLTPEEERDEAARRRRQLSEAKVDTSLLSDSGLLGDFFFKLIKSFLEAIISGMAIGAAASETRDAAATTPTPPLATPPVARVAAVGTLPRH